MLNRFSNLFVTFAFALTAVFGVSSIGADFGANEVFAATSIFDNQTLNTNNTNSEASQITSSIFKAANIFSGFVLAISIIMIIFGGLRYILANGDQRQAESGKMILIYSGIGIVIALSAFVIARLFAGFAV